MTRVLFVDDARLLAEVEGSPLGRSNFEVHTIGPSTDVVRLVQEMQPAVVVLGEGESCPDALEVCRRLRANAATRSVAIIYIGMGLNRERGKSAGADVFIPRPFTRLEFREALHQVLSLRDRIAFRRDVDLPVEISFGEQIVRARCRDMSLSGAFVVPERSLEPGERGTLRFQANGRRLEVAVEIVRRGRGACGQDGAGLSFHGLDADTGAFLSRFVRTAGERRAPSPELAAPEDQP